MAVYASKNSMNMGKIACLMREYLDSVSREQLEKDIEEIKNLGLQGPSMKDFLVFCENRPAFVCSQVSRDNNCFTDQDSNLFLAA